MDTEQQCLICGLGAVTEHVQLVHAEYKGQTAQVPQYYKLCSHCTSDFAGPAESKRNRRALLAFHKQVDGLLTGDEVRALREQYDLTQAQASKLFGGGPVAFSKYENDDVAQSAPMDALLRVVRRSQAAFWALVQERGMEAEFTQSQHVSFLPDNVVRIDAYLERTVAADVSYQEGPPHPFALEPELQWEV